MVLAPQEYKSNLTKEEIYRQNFLYWESWQGELVEALLSSRNRKKPLDCALQALKNLQEMSKMLKADTQKKLDVYFNRLQALKDEIAQDIYGTNTSSQRMDAERIRRAVSRDFSYNKIKGSLL